MRRPLILVEVSHRGAVTFGFDEAYLYAAIELGTG